MIVKPTSESESEAAANRRKRRADRNRLRAVKHAHKLLDQVAEGSQGGFSHLGWSNAASAFAQVSQFLTLEEYSNIGQAWRETYADELPSTQLEELVAGIKHRVENAIFDEVVERDPWERQSRKTRI